MAQYGDLTVLDGLTKKIYGKGISKAVPDNIREFFTLFPFSKSEDRLGSLFHESVTLQAEQGVTRMSGTAGVQSLNDSVASVNKQCYIDGSVIVMQATLAWDIFARTRGGANSASFANALTQVIDSVTLSHRRHQVADMLYGGTELAVIETGATSATQTLSKASTAQGLWYGSNGAKFDLYSSNLGTKRNTDPLTLIGHAVDPTATSRTITFDQSVASTTGDVVVWAGTVTSSTITTPWGLSKITGATGTTLFGLSQVTYPVFTAAQYAVSGTLSLNALDRAATLPLMRGYTGVLKLLINPITYSVLVNEQTARIHLTGSATSGTASLGYDDVRITTSTGAKISVCGSPHIKEGEGYLIPMNGSVKRIGTDDVTLGGPASSGDSGWRRMEGMSGYVIPTFSLQAMFTASPWECTKLTGITNG